MDRRRNIVVRAEQTKALDDLFRSKEATFTYNNGTYLLHFAKPVPVNSVKEWSGCTDVEPFIKAKQVGPRKRKTENKNEDELKAKRPTTASIYQSVRKAQAEYDNLLAKGEMIDTVLRKYGFSEEVLQPKHTKPLKIYRSKEKRRQEMEAMKKEVNNGNASNEDIFDIPEEIAKITEDDRALSSVFM